MLGRLILIALILAAPVSASASGKKADKAAAVEPYVDLEAIGLPIIVGGKLKNYVFVQARLHVAKGQDAAKLAPMEPWYRDAVVRAAHRRPFVRSDSWVTVDDARLQAVLLAEARRISGPGAFSKAEILRQAPRKRVGPRAASR